MGAKTILVVEDEFLIRFNLSDTLRGQGYQVLEAANGDEAHDVLISGQSVDLIITDVQMPGLLDGVELTRLSKQLAPGRPVIVCSAHLSLSDSGPADAFLAKPYLMAALVDAIERLIGDPWQKNSHIRSA